MTLLLKLLLAPLLVVGSSLAGRRWGDRVAGQLVAFPIVAGPILLITCLQQGVPFGARAASASLLGLVSLAVFVVALAHLGRRLTWPLTLVSAVLATLVADLLLSRFAIGAYISLVVVLLSIVVAHRLVAMIPAAPVTAEPVARPWWDLPGRAVATAVLVLVVTGAAAAVGPVLTGILAPFPIATSVVAAFVLAQQGLDATVRTMAGVIGGLVGFAAFCFTVAVLLRPLGIAGSFLVAFVVALPVQLVRSRSVLRARVPARRQRLGSGG